MDVGGDEVPLAVGELKNVFDEMGTGKEIILIGHEKNRFDFLVEVTVHLRHLEFIFKVGDRPQAPYEGDRVELFSEIHDQPIKCHHFNRLVIRKILTDELEAFVRGKGGLFAGIAGNRHNDLIKDAPRATDHIEMPVGDGVEGAWVNSGSHISIEMERKEGLMSNE